MRRPGPVRGGDGSHCYCAITLSGMRHERTTAGPVIVRYVVAGAGRSAIRDLVGTARTCIIEIGRELIAAKAQVAHGEWLPWLRDEFEWGETTARKYMQVAEAFKSALGVDFAGLTIDASALYALSAPDGPLR